MYVVCHCLAHQSFYRLIAGYKMVGGDHEVPMHAWGVRGSCVCVCVYFQVCTCSVHESRYMCMYVWVNIAIRNSLCSDVKVDHLPSS